jgi:uncharacterized protein (DUF433 family)
MKTEKLLSGVSPDLIQVEDKEERSQYRRVEIGKYIVADPSVSHGQPMFRGTRVLVHRVIKSFRRGDTIDEVAADYKIPCEAVLEALYLAAEALLEKYDVPYPEPLPMEELLKLPPDYRDENYPRVEISKYIVADPSICHGQPTFRGTRVIVHLALKSFSYVKTIDKVAWGYDIPREAVIEGLYLAAEALLEKYTVSYPKPLSIKELSERKSVPHSVP